MIQAYYDLKQGETLAIDTLGVALSVRKLASDGSALTRIRSRYHSGTRYLRRGQYVRLDERMGVFNYGNRHHGRRMHIRLEIYGDSLPPVERITSN